MASEATEMAVRGNMHIDTRVIEVPDFKTEVKFVHHSYPLSPLVYRALALLFCSRWFTNTKVFKQNDCRKREFLPKEAISAKRHSFCIYAETSNFLSAETERVSVDISDSFV